MRYYIYSKNGSIKRCYAEKLEFSGQFMGSCSLSINVKWHEHIDFEIGDYIEYRGEKYTLSNIPTEKKVAHKNATSQSFQYDNIKFESCISELSIADFNDFVGDSQTDISFTAQPNFSFVAKTVSDLAQRIQVNLDRYYTGDKKWTITIDSDFVNDPEKDDMLISVSNISCWDALAYVKSKYDTNFIVRGRTVTIGTSGAINDITFKVGKYNGLYDMTRNSQSEQAIITRLKSYGNTTNINPRYYSLVGSSVTATAVYAKMIVEGTNLCMYIRYSDAAYGTELYSTVVATFTYVGATHTASMTYDEKSLAYKITASTSYQKAAVDGINMALLPNAKYTPTRNTTATLSSGVRIENITDLSRITPNPAYTIPNNMNIANLMLPGFPKQTLAEWVEANKSKYSWLQTYVNLGYTFSTDRIYPYIDSKNVSQLGILPHTEYFTSEDETHKDIYPSLQYFQDDRNKVVSITNEDGTAITDSGIFKEGATVPNVKINVNDLGFLISDVRISGTDPKLHFNSGYCGGMDFSIMTSGKNTDGTTYFVCKRVEDDAIGKYFPYKDAMILNGDKFVITDIYMPDTFIEQASIELLKWSLKWLAKNDYTVFSYSLSPDPIFIKRHDDAINDKTTTFYRSIKEGDVLNIQDTDIGINDSITIDTLKITEGDGLLPKYDITLKDTKSVGTIQKMQQQIDAIVGGGDFNSSQIQAIAEKSLRDTFLSKVKEDTASQKITFAKGLNVGGKDILDISALDATDTSVLGVLQAAYTYLTKSDAAQTYLNKITSSAQSIAGETSFNAALHALKELIGNVIQSTSFTSAGFAGSGYKLWFDGTTSHLEVDEATIRKVMYVFELVISQVKHIGGRLIMSDASCVASLVEEFTDYYTVSFDATDGTRTVNNEWEVGDFAYCQTFNLKSGTRYYWRKVIGVTSEPNANGKHQIQLSKTIYDDSVTNNAPIVGDNIVQLGGVNAGRQSAIILSTVGDDAPSIKQFDDIGQGTTNAEMFSLVGKEKQVISPSGNKFTGSFVFESTGEDVKTLINAVPGKITLAVNNVQIGGRNLLLTTGTDFNKFKYVGGWNRANGVASYSNNYYSGLGSHDVSIDGGKPYTLRFNAVVSTSLYFAQFFIPSTCREIGRYLITNGENVITINPQSSCIVEVRFFGIRRTSGNISLSEIKLEQGNKATDYTEAPEDTDAKIQVTADAITSEVTARTAQGEELKTSIKQNADSISAKVATIGSGYNLLPYGNFSDSRASSDKNKWNINGAATTAIDTDATAGQGLKISFTSGTSGVGIWQNIGSYATYTKDEYVIFSFDARCNAGQTACQLYVGLEGATLYTVNVTLYYAYHRYAIVQQVPNAWNGVVRIYTGATMPLSSFCVRKIKLGRGESDTNYIPSLLDTGIDISKGKITLIADNTTFLTNSGEKAAEINSQGLVTIGLRTNIRNNISNYGEINEDGSYKLYDTSGIKRMSIDLDTNGTPNLFFYAVDGTVLYNIGPSGYLGMMSIDTAAFNPVYLIPINCVWSGSQWIYMPCETDNNGRYGIIHQAFKYFAANKEGKYLNTGDSSVDRHYFWHYAVGSIPAILGDGDMDYDGVNSGTYYMNGVNGLFLLSDVLPSAATTFQAILDQGNHVFQFQNGIKGDPITITTSNSSNLGATIMKGYRKLNPMCYSQANGWKTIQRTYPTTNFTSNGEGYRFGYTTSSGTGNFS